MFNRSSPTAMAFFSCRASGRRARQFRCFIEAVTNGRIPSSPSSASGSRSKVTERSQWVGTTTAGLSESDLESSSLTGDEGGQRSHSRRGASKRCKQTHLSENDRRSVLNQQRQLKRVPIGEPHASVRCRIADRLRRRRTVNTVVLSREAYPHPPHRRVGTRRK